MCIRDSTGTLKTCNNGAIVGRSLRVEDNSSYTSQLNVTVSSDMFGESIECAHVPNAIDVIVIGFSILSTTTG